MFFLTKWLQERELQKAKHNNEVQVVIGDGLQFNSRVQLNIKEQELAIADKAYDLRYKIGLNNTEISKRLLALQKEQGELEKVKAQFRMHLENERLEMEIKKERFYSEQERENKKLDYDFALSKGNLELQARKMEYDFLLEKERLQITREQQQNDRIRLEAERMEKTLTAILTSYTLSKEQNHKERLQELEALHKEFEMQISFIKLYTTERQAMEYQNLQMKMQERLNNLFNGNLGGLNGEY